MIESTGTIYKIKGDQAIIVVSVNPFELEKQNIKSCLVRFDDGRTIKSDQRKKAYAIISDITDFTGDAPEYMKEYLKYCYINRTGEEYFSLADCTVTTAREFISFLIDFCFEHNIGTRDTLLNNTDDIDRYLYSCIARRKCAVCNDKAEIHHCTGSKIGMGVNRDKVNNIGRYAIALCRKHHNMAHSDESKFFKDHHIYGIKLDKYLCQRANLNYS